MKVNYVVVANLHDTWSKRCLNIFIASGGFCMKISEVGSQGNTDKNDKQSISKYSIQVIYHVCFNRMFVISDHCEYMGSAN